MEIDCVQAAELLGVTEEELKTVIGDTETDQLGFAASPKPRALQQKRYSRH